MKVAPFLAAGNQGERESQFLRQLRGAAIHQRAAGLKEHRHFAGRRRRERLEAGIKFRTGPALRMLREIGVIQRVMLRVKKGLAHHGDHPHERLRVGGRLAGVRLESDVLKHVRLQDCQIGIVAGQRHQCARSADDAVARHYERGRETRFAKRRERFGLRCKIPGRAPVGRDAGERITGRT